MKAISLFVTPLLCCTLATTTLAAEWKKPGPSLSDALFDPSRVIQIEIRLDPKDWHALRISHPIVQDDGFIAVAEKGYEYSRADVIIDGRSVKSVGVRKKGVWGSATAFARPSLKIKFDEYVKDQEFAGLDTMTLNNCIWDPTKAQQVLVYDFMSRAGIPAPRSNLARVIVNGEDLGVYGHVESIGKRFIKRHFKDAKGDLYESEQGDFSTSELDRVNRFERIVHKWGADKERSYLRGLMNELEKSDSVSLKRIEELVDLDAFITFWAAEVLIGSHDSYSGSRNNFHVYRDATSGKLFFLPWGRDVGFNNPAYYPDTIPKSIWAAGILCQRLWQLPEVRLRYRIEMQRLLDSVWNEKAMLAELDRVARAIEPYRRVTVSWGERGSDQVVAFVNRRRNEVQAELKGPPPDWPDFPPPKPTPKLIGVRMQIEGSFSAVMRQSSPTNLISQGSAQIEFAVNGQARKPFTHYGAVAFPIKPRDRELTRIAIDAADPAGELRWRLRFNIDPYCLSSGKAELNMFGLWATLVQGDPSRPDAPARSADQVKGALELTQVSTNLGGTISGKFKINTTAFEEEKK